MGALVAFGRWCELASGCHNALCIRCARSAVQLFRCSQVILDAPTAEALGRDTVVVYAVAVVKL